MTQPARKKETATQLGWRSLNNSRNHLLLGDFNQFNFHWYT